MPLQANKGPIYHQGSLLSFTHSLLSIQWTCAPYDTWSVNQSSSYSASVSFHHHIGLSWRSSSQGSTRPGHGQILALSFAGALWPSCLS
jgi:hypothetical protein